MTSKVSHHDSHELKPKLLVFGIGGAGSNAVNNMIISQLVGVEFWVANTDAQALKTSSASNKIQLGIASTKGLGAGSNPEIGRIAAEESIEQIKGAMEGCHMVFITAGMGGGTGTGAAPTVAKLAKELSILTVGVVTKPFHFEGARRMKIAELGLEEMEKYVDTLIVIPNQNLFRVANEKTTFADAFKTADMVLNSGVQGVTDLITMPGLINLDFADIRTVMSEMGKAMMGTGEAEGENRATKAAEAAISNPLLDNSSMKGAKGVLINITGGEDMTLFEVDEAANRIKEEVDPNANIIFGSSFHPELKGKLRVSVVATGIDSKHKADTNAPQNFSSRDTTVNKVAVPTETKPLDSTKHDSSKELKIKDEIKIEKKSSKFGDKDKIRVSGSFMSTTSANYSKNQPATKGPFIPKKPLDPSSDDFSANKETALQPVEKLLQSLAPSDTNTNLSKGSEESKPVKKRDFFDIPAFLRKNK